MAGWVCYFPCKRKFAIIYFSLIHIFSRQAIFLTSCWYEANCTRIGLNNSIQTKRSHFSLGISLMFTERYQN